MPKNTLFTLLLSTVILTLVLVFLFSCSRHANKTDSQKYLRAFDAEVTNHAKRIVASRGFQSLTKLFYLPGTPIPFVSDNVKLGEDSLTAYDLGKVKGTYAYDEQTSRWNYLSPGNDSIPLRLIFSDPEEKELELRLFKYSESVSLLGMTFPTLMEAMILDKNHKLMVINYIANLKEGFPENAKLQLTMSGYDCRLNLVTSITGRKTADIDIQLAITKDSVKVLEANLYAEAAIGNYQTLNYNHIRGNISAFPIEVVIRSDYESERWASEDFFENWNAQSHINIYAHDGRLLGKVKLRRMPVPDRANLIIQYNDGSEENLEDIMLLVKSILNVKIVRPAI